MAVVMGSLFLVTGVASAAETTTPSWDPTLIQAKSCAEVEGVFKEYFMSNRNGGSFGPVRGGVIMNDAATREALSADGKGAGGGAGDFSQTNNQKTGVDEPDVIKNDGKYIYYVDANSARKIHIVAAATAGRVEASISLPQDVWGTQIFLHKGMLIVVGGKAAPYAYNAYETSMIARDQKATVMIYDITNPKAPKLQSAYEYDGYIQESRVVDGKLVLITSQSFTRGPVYMMRDKAMQTTTSQTIKPTDFAFTSRQLLPSWTSMQPTTITYRNGTQRFTTAKSTTQVDCTNVLYKKPDPKGNTHY